MLFDATGIRRPLQDPVKAAMLGKIWHRRPEFVPKAAIMSSECEHVGETNGRNDIDYRTSR